MDGPVSFTKSLISPTLTANMTSPCPNKYVCGSCSWSEIPYKKQLEQKLGDINGSLALKERPERVERILPSPVTSHYRNRMDFVIDFEGRVGMREKGKWWRVIDDHHCFIADESIEDAFKIVREWAQSCGLSFFDRKAHTGFLRYAVIRSTTLGEVMITIVTSVPESGEEQAVIEQLIDLANPTVLNWAVNDTTSDVSHSGDNRILHGPGFITEEICNIRYQISPNAFFQTNSQAAGLLIDEALKFSGDIAEKNVLDLYCGTGFFSLAYAKAGAKSVTGYEMVPEAIVDAKKNAELNNLNVTFDAAKTEDVDWWKHEPDLVLIDPPRAGLLGSALDDLLAHPPKDLIYVSCNYKNFARELKQLSEVYDVSDMVAVDMFPHTPHVELITKLVRK